MLLADESSLLPQTSGGTPAKEEALPVLELSSATAPPQEVSYTEPAQKGTAEKLINLAFEQTGSLGIEFKRTAAPYIVETVHEQGLAHGRGLQPGDRLELVGGEPVAALDWQNLVPRLTTRPITVSFSRAANPDASNDSGSGGSAALLTGLTGRMRFLGGAAAAVGTAMGSASVDLGTKVSSAGIGTVQGLGSSVLAGLGFEETEEAEEWQQVSQQTHANGPVGPTCAAIVSQESPVDHMAAGVIAAPALAKADTEVAVEESPVDHMAAGAIAAPALAKADPEVAVEAVPQQDQQLPEMSQEMPPSLPPHQPLAAASTVPDSSELGGARGVDEAVPQQDHQLPQMSQELPQSLPSHQPLAAVHTAPGSSELAGARVVDEAMLQQLRLDLETARNDLGAARSELSLAHSQCERLKCDVRVRDDRLLKVEAEAQANVTAVSQKEKEAGAALAQLRAEAELLRQQAAATASDAAGKAHALEAARAAETSQTMQIQELQASATKARSQREQEAAAANGQLEQLRFALADKDRQLEERKEAMTKKEQDIKNLLRQLAAAGDGSKSLQQAFDSTTTEEEAPPPCFEALFALTGSLGLEFQRQAAPYVVSRVHTTGVASGLGISPGDQLVAVAEEDVTQASWPDLVRRLGQRPVAVRFRRAQTKEDGEGSGLISSVSSVGSALLTKAMIAVPGKAGEAPDSTAAVTARLQAEVERLATLLQARDEEVAELGNRLDQSASALKVLEAGSGAAADTARIVQDYEASQQQVRLLQTRLEAIGQDVAHLREDRDAAVASRAEGARLLTESQTQVAALTERYQSLMTQFQTLSSNCESLSLETEQKAGLEGQVQELVRMNAKWQEAHQNLTSESESLRERAVELHRLQAENAQLRQFREACSVLEHELSQADGGLEALRTEVAQLQDGRNTDQATISRLQALLTSMEESGESQAGQLEAELLARSSECTALRRQVEDQRARLQELLRNQGDCQAAAEAGRSLQSENETLRQDLEKARKEHTALSGVVEQCIAKLEKESRERPHLTDKRMVTQMLAAYLEQRDNPRQQQEIMVKMADLLGFTTAEREQVGLSQRRRALLGQEDEPVGIVDLTDRFVDFLIEESEGV